MRRQLLRERNTLAPPATDLYRLRPDFVYSVSRDLTRTRQTPMLVLPDDVASHPLQASIDIASLCPNAEMFACLYEGVRLTKGCLLGDIRE